MKKLVVLAGLLQIFAVCTTQAVMQVVLYQNLTNYSHGNAGEFNALPNAALLSVNPTLTGYAPTTADLTAVNPYFQTFCVEEGEFFSPGSTYNVTISTEVLYNGGQFPAGEPITLGTAWLYSRFADGTLSGYDYTYGSDRITSAGDLQQALWYLQGEVTSLVSGGADGTAFYNAAVFALGGTVTNAANGAYGVVALNLWVPGPNGSNGAAAQDQLMVIPGPTTVPEPTTTGFACLLLLLPGIRKTRALFRKRA